MTNDPSADPGACPAHGCPLRASIDLSGSSRFVCSAHAGQDMGRWQAITHELRAHQWLLDHMADLRKPAALRGWRQIAGAFWATSEPERMRPAATEDRELYLYRLHLELLRRVGASSVRPDPLVPQGRQFAQQHLRRQPAQRGRTGDLLGGLAQGMRAPPVDEDERLAEAKVRAQQQVDAYQHREIAAA